MSATQPPNTQKMRQASALLNQAADYIDAMHGKGPNVKYGCHCDLEPGMSPDGCSLLTGDVYNCVYARKLLELNKGPQDCEYWKPIRLVN